MYVLKLKYDDQKAIAIIISILIVISSSNENDSSRGVGTFSPCGLKSTPGAPGPDRYIADV